jgi:predicted O-methyltransferase YrrM
LRDDILNTLIGSIDPHEGKLSYPRLTPSGMVDAERLTNPDEVAPTLGKLTHNLAKAELDDIVKIVVSKSTDFTFGGAIDFLFIDGLHDYDSVKADWEHFKPMLADGAVVAFHDYGN